MKLPNYILNDFRNHAIGWAMDMLDSNYLILDTETTGLGNDDEVIQLSMIDNKYLKYKKYFFPKVLIKPAAMKVHGIEYKFLMHHSVEFFDEYEYINAMLEKVDNIIIYNKEFDMRLLNQTCAAYGLNEFKFSDMNVYCAMYYYTLFKGEWEPEKLRFKNHKLPSATHDAMDDCYAVLNIMKEMVIKGETLFR